MKLQNLLKGKKVTRVFIACAAVLLLLSGVVIGITIDPSLTASPDPGSTSEHAFTVRGIHLTWPENDVYHTMAVSWWTKGAGAKSVVLYDTEAHGGATGEYAFKAEGVKQKIVTTRSTLENWYRDVILTGLEPGTTYYFVCGGPGHWSEEYNFRTIGLDQHVRFAVGGDSRSAGATAAEWGYGREGTEGRVKSQVEGPGFPDARIAVSDAVAAEDVDFILFNGDTGYRIYDEYQMEWWFDDISGHLVTDEGRIIPIVMVIGDHDIGRFYSSDIDSWRDMTDYDYYRGMFCLPGNELWYTLDFPDIRIIVLCAVGGTGFVDSAENKGERVLGEVLAQKDWLEEQLATNTKRWVITGHHNLPTSGYGIKPGDWGYSIIDHWCPLFEEYGLDIDTAAHSHLMLRTWPISHFEIAEDFVDFGDTPDDLWPNGPPIIELTQNSEDGVTYYVNGNWGAVTEFMEKDSFVRIYPWFAAARARPSYGLFEVTEDELHVTTKAVGRKRTSWGLPLEMDEFTLPYIAPADFPTAEYTVAF